VNLLRIIEHAPETVEPALNGAGVDRALERPLKRAARRAPRKAMRSLSAVDEPRILPLD
jgi:hypothetical protein